MNTYTIENESNNIIAHSSAEEAANVADAVQFETEAELAQVSADWPAARLIEIWNSLPGVTPVKKFTNRETAIRRIFAAISNLGEAAPVTAVPDTPPATPDVQPAEGGTGEEPTAKKATKRAQKIAKPREPNKTETVLALLKRDFGATSEELMTATGWQAHSVRGFLAGTVRKKLGLALNSEKREDGKRIYSLPA